MPNFTEAGLFVTVFVDASFCPKLNAAGFGAWIKFDEPGVTRRVGGPVHLARSPGDAETYAIVNTLRYIVKSQVPILDKVIIIQSDCEEALRRLRAMQADDLLPEEYREARRIIFRHVKGHQGYTSARASVNTWCDREAKRYMRMQRIIKRKERRNASKASLALR